MVCRYNPNLTGFSTGSNVAKLPGLCPITRLSFHPHRCRLMRPLLLTTATRAGKNAGLNVAVSGAVASDLLPQAQKLVEVFKSRAEQVRVF